MPKLGIGLFVLCIFALKFHSCVANLNSKSFVSYKNSGKSTLQKANVMDNKLEPLRYNYPCGKYTTVQKGQLKQYSSSKFPASCIEVRVKQLQSKGISKKSSFLEEFKSLKQQHQKFLNKLPRKEGRKPGNIHKNRHKQHIAFDHSRVILKEPWSEGDYINANYIRPKGKLFKGSTKSYIATQGALPTTISEFWFMIWQENSKVIVSLTPEFENGRVRCAHYWPDSGQVINLEGGLKITHQEESIINDLIIRELILSKDGEDRVIYQFQFNGWPDHKTPKNPEIMLKLLEEINQRQQNIKNAGPIVVHCSAGIGRTGTYIVIDLLLDQIKRNGLNTAIDIKRTLRMVRKQRGRMVSGLMQYKFIYLTVLHYVETMKKLKA